MSDDYSTVFLWVSSDDKMNASDTVTNYSVQLQNRIDNPVSADLVEVLIGPASGFPSMMFISSRALGQSTLSGKSTGAQRWWRVIPINNSPSTDVFAFYNPRVEHTPVYQPFLQNIDIQITAADGTPIHPNYFGSISILVAVRVKRA